MIVWINLSGDERTDRLCEKYWRITHEGKFRFSAEQVGREFDLSAEAVESIIENNSVAFWTDHYCSVCSRPAVYFKRRSEFLEAIERTAGAVEKRNRGEGHLLCGDCERRRPLNLLSAWPVRIAKEELDMMEKVLAAGQHLLLGTVEMEVLAALVREPSLDDALESLIPRPAAEHFLKKLVEKRFVAWDLDSAGYWMLPELVEYVKYGSKVRSIFDDEHDVYYFHQFKRSFLFVFPKLPLCVIIPRHMVEDLLQEQWQVECYLTYEIDYVLCNREGRPELLWEVMNKGRIGQEKREFAKKLADRAKLPFIAYEFD